MFINSLPTDRRALLSERLEQATERERPLTTGKRAERTKRDFRCRICHSAIGQASCLICARRRSFTGEALHDDKKRLWS